MEPKKLIFVCSNCGYREEKYFAKNAIPEATSICPECNRMALSIHTPTFVERMKENAGKL